MPESPKHKLGSMLNRYRTNAGMSLEDAAAKIGVTPLNLAEVEAGNATMKAELLQKAAEVYGVLYEPILEAARDWNNAVFATGGGVELSEPEMSEGAIRTDVEEMERELIRCADDLAFLANVLRESYVKAMKSSERARTLLRERGVPIPESPQGEIVDCSGPNHPHAVGSIRLGIDYVLKFVPEDGSPNLYFCSDVCAREFQEAQ